MTSFNINDVILYVSVFVHFEKKLSRLKTATIIMNNLEDLEISAHVLLLKCRDSFPDLITQEMCE